MTSAAYESERLLGEYLLFHYGTSAEVLPYEFGPREAWNFPARVVHDCVDFGALPEHARALDLGCAVGRSTFELAVGCEEVVGIDFSANFVRAARTLAGTGRMPYQRVDEGVLTTECEAIVTPGIDRSRAKFEVGDACDLRPDLGKFDVALLINLLDRLPDPMTCLRRLPVLLNPGAQLVIASPFTWLEDFTPREKWLGGFLSDGKRVLSFDALREILAPNFDFQRQAELPFLIREHVRKFQWSVSLAGIWRRKS